MVLMHNQRNVRKCFHSRLNQVLDEWLAGVLAGTRAGLKNNRRTHLVGSGHNSLNLFQVVHIEGGDAIAVFGGMVQQLAHGYERHFKVSEK